MRKIVAILICLIVYCIGKAQLYDAQWAIGYNESILDFRNSDTVKVDTLPTLDGFLFTNSCICDENGDLIYYTNGINICNPNHILTNSYGLSNCGYTRDDSIDGLNIAQAAIFIPKPGNTRYYYLFHLCNDVPNDPRPRTIYYSLIDKEVGNGGALIEKNVPILQVQKLREGGMTACKHANGRDYWIIMGGSNNNEFYKFLLTPDGIQGPFIQNIGPVFPTPYDVAYSRFSLDGSKFLTGIYVGAPILVMDFDRCSGEFRNPTTIFNTATNNPNDSTISGIGSADFSPSGRFVYATNSQILNQYDLLSSNVSVPIQLYQSDTDDEYEMRLMQAALNGKIYISTFNGGLKAYHVINYPDLKGDSANFVYGGQPTFSIATINVPNLINYKLGPLIGSGCDTITGVKEPSASNQMLRILPNPANKFLYVEMAMQGNYEFELVDINGQLIDKRETPQVDYFDTEHLAAGNYFLRVLNKATGNEVGTKKVIVVH